MKAWQERVNSINQIKIQKKEKQLQHKHIHELITVFHFYFFPFFFLPLPHGFTQFLFLNYNTAEKKIKEADLI